MLFHIRLLLLATAVFALCGVSAVQAQQLSAQDRAFMEDAAKRGMHEIQMGHLGIERGQSQAVKGFSQRLINDHNLANQELAALAKQKSVVLPGDDAKVMPMPIVTKSGADFDKEFGRVMIEDHRQKHDDHRHQSYGTDQTPARAFLELQFFFANRFRHDQ